ncbi:MAG: peptidoglycan DD-metalloendopeptidase family protein [Archangium sp.]|nr:peptidoglycan DD-metalloendopeptidase family protein [Archangium sp.]
MIALASALLHSLWQLAALALVFAALRPLLRTPSHRYAVAMLTLSAQVLAPIVTFVERMSRETTEAAIGGGPTEEPAWAFRIVIAWSIGAALVSLRVAGGLLTIRNWIRAATPVPVEFRARLTQLAAGWKLTRVRFLATTRDTVPMTVGFLKPVVLIPLSLFTALPAESLELLIAHELAHVRRWDYLANLLQRAAEALLFFHPAVWWVSARARDERELCCDDLVTRGTGANVAYAEALLALEEHRHVTAGLALASHGGSLMKRVERLVAPTRTAQPAWGLALIAAVFTLTAVSLISAPARAEGRTLGITWLPPVLEPVRGDIERAAAEHGIDADLLALFVLVESQGDPRALSPSGARGLMQLMPKTAERVAGELKVPYAPELLDEPRFNLDLGATYLATQLGTYKGDPRQVELAAASYNGGPKAVRAWLDGKGTLSRETDQYRTLVSGLWSERTLPSSPTWSAWRGSYRERAAAKSVAPISAKASMEFGTQPHPFSGQPYQHQGVDLPAAIGTPVKAPLDGVVTEISSDASMGTVLVLRHRGGLTSRFHHLGAVKVALAQQVTAGAPVAEVGMTGKTTGPHVHFEVRDLGEPIDPKPFLR